jgi:hypothetical protein
MVTGSVGKGDLVFGDKDNDSGKMGRMDNDINNSLNLI